MTQDTLFGNIRILDLADEKGVYCTKLFATEMVTKAVDRAIQIHGGLGYTKELPLERMYRDVRGMRIYEGTDEIHRYIIARSLLRE